MNTLSTVSILIAFVQSSLAANFYIKSPYTGQSWNGNEKGTVTWDYSAGDSPATTIVVDLMDGPDNKHSKVMTINGAADASSGETSFTVPDSLVRKSEYFIRIKAGSQKFYSSRFQINANGNPAADAKRPVDDESAAYPLRAGLAGATVFTMLSCLFA